MTGAPTICERCRFAKWERTKAGHRHPNGLGVCMWKKAFRVAASYHLAEGQPLRVCGGVITRIDHPDLPMIFRCDVFQDGEYREARQ